MPLLSVGSSSTPSIFFMGIGFSQHNLRILRLYECTSASDLLCLLKIVIGFRLLIRNGMTVQRRAMNHRSACLALPAIAQIVLQALQCVNGQRYQLHAWTVMPNHVHVLFTPSTGESLSQILHSWKSFSANKANSIMGKTGSFWQREYFDRAVRNEEHFAAAIEYINNNPVKAGLCQTPADWLFSSASPARECSAFQKTSVIKT